MVSLDCLLVLNAFVFDKHSPIFLILLHFILDFFKFFFFLLLHLLHFLLPVLELFILLLVPLAAEGVGLQKIEFISGRYE